MRDAVTIGTCGIFAGLVLAGQLIGVSDAPAADLRVDDGIMTWRAAPPAHELGGGGDTCATATPIGLESVPGTTFGATSDGAADCGNSARTADRWFAYTADAFGLLTVTTCGWVGYDTVLSVHSACPGTPANQVACNDNTCGLQSSTSAVLSAGETVYIRVSGMDGASGTFIVDTSFDAGPPPFLGPDVVYSDCTDITDWGPVGDVRGYALETSTCNVGTQNLMWGTTTGGSPVVGFNAYRLADGRLMQIGMSWAKHGTGAAPLSGCGVPCNGQGGNVLGAGCRDVYSASFNGTQGILGPRSQVNAWTGSLRPAPPAAGDDIDRRLQIAESELNAGLHPGASYFVEGVYVGLDDAGVFGNANNNASHRRVTVGGDFSLNVTDVMQVGTPAIQAWRDHGAGAGQPDPRVEIVIVDVPNEGRFYVAGRAEDLGTGAWRYDYAVFNLNSDRAARSLTIPVAPGVALDRIGFHDVDYHSGEPYDGTDWPAVVGTSSVTWSTAHTHAQNPDANALRWGTMYNFWFTADTPPVDVAAAVGLFKPQPGGPDSVTAVLPGPGATCPQDLNGNGDIDFADALIVIVTWGTCDACPEDLDHSGDVGFSDLLEVITSWGPCP